MDFVNVTKDLVNLTLRLSRFEEKRNYISLSHIVKPAEHLIADYKKGFQFNTVTKLKCYKGYQMEEDLLRRLIILYPNAITTGTEYSLHNGLFKGHPDFEYLGMPGDCKSVLMDEWLPALPDCKLPLKVIFQMNAYMMCADKNNAVVVYESRENGVLRHAWLKKDEFVQKEISEKIEIIRYELNQEGNK